MTIGSSGRRSVAVVGGGIAGLGAAWALARRHTVTLYDREGRFGGHANTVDVASIGQRFPVDTGFIVYNGRNYPNLVALFDHLAVPTAASDMSFGVSLDGGRVEYSGGDLNGLLAQRLNVLKPRFWRMLNDIRRFYGRASGYLEQFAQDCTIGELLEREHYSDAFIEDHLVPMAAAIWSASACDIRRYPADAFIRFFDNHGLLSLGDRPQWRTVRGGSREYVGRLLDDADLELRPGRAVQAIERTARSVTVVEPDGARRDFDDVVIATHADQALELLGDADDDERAVLGAFRYSDNLAWLHEDTRLMPRRKAAWSSWNYLHASDSQAAQPLCVSYWMNRLQPLATSTPIFVTLNPGAPPAADKVHGCYSYQHPVFSRETTAAQSRSAAIQGRRRTWWCGSYFGHGFHEDALQSGLWVAEQLGAARPWPAAGDFDRLPQSYRGDRSRAA